MSRTNEKERIIRELQEIARVLGARDWRELDRVFRSAGSSKDIDMLWVKYVYLRDMLKKIEENNNDGEENT